MLGVRRIRLTMTRRTNADRANIGRLRAIAAEAAEQTGRLDVPAIEAPAKLDRLIDGWEAGRRLLFCDEAGDAASILDALGDAPAGPWAILVGPEGGFSEKERQDLLNYASVIRLSLGPRIMRADTAAVAALTLVQAVCGDLA